MYSGVDKRNREERTGNPKEESYKEKVTEWESVNSRINRVNRETEEKISLIQTYASNQYVK